MQVAIPQSVGVFVRWPGKMAACPAYAGEHSFFPGFFVSFFAKSNSSLKFQTRQSNFRERSVAQKPCFLMVPVSPLPSLVLFFK
jgi:hypothetical protein